MFVCDVCGLDESSLLDIHNSLTMTYFLLFYCLFRPMSHPNRRRRRIPTATFAFKILCALSFWISISESSYYSSSVAAIESPVPNLEASLLASAALTAVVAVRCSSVSTDCTDDSVVILRCSRTRPESFILRPDDDTFSQNNNSKISNKGDDILHLLHERLGLTLATTGLTSDTRYLVQTAKQYLTLLQYIYHSDSYHSLATHKFAKDAVARTLLRATQVRALGVQALVVGNNNNPRRGQDDEASLNLYTADPSGTWKHWGSGVTSIGLFAQTIRRQLEIIVSNQNLTSSHPWERALEAAIKAFLQALSLEEDAGAADVSYTDDSVGSRSLLHSDWTSQPHFSPCMPGASIAPPLVLNNGFHIQATVVLGNVQAKQQGFRWATVSSSFIYHCVKAQKLDMPLTLHRP